MDIKFNINEYDVRQSFESALRDKVYELIQPTVEKLLLERINKEEIAKIIEDRLKDTLRYGTYNDNRMNSDALADMFDSKITELVKNISDEELKSMLLERMFNNLK